MEDLIEIILGRNKDRRDDGLFGGLIGSAAKWVRNCGCMLVLLVIGLVAALLGGLVTLSDDQITIVIVFITMIVAIVSLIRSSLGY